MASLDSAFGSLLNNNVQQQNIKKISLTAINDMGHLEFLENNKQFRSPLELYKLVYNDIIVSNDKQTYCIILTVKNNIASKIYKINDVYINVNFTQLT